MKLFYITFRMDDICPQMDFGNFMEYKMLFDEYGIKPLLGIVPDNQDGFLKIDDDYPDFWIMMKQLQEDGWVIAQHGYQHVYCSHVEGILSRRKLSEFTGLSYEDQVEKISKGKRILEEKGLHTDIFMAPGHSFDVTTLRALKDCGFKYVTDGKSSLPYMYYDLKFIPCRNGIPLNLPGINTWCIHANTSTEKAFNRIKKSLNTKYACDFQVIKHIPCVNTFFCQKEEKLYELLNRYVVDPLIQLKERITNRLR